MKSTREENNMDKQKKEQQLKQATRKQVKKTNFSFTHHH